VRERREGRAPLRLYFFLRLSFVLLFFWCEIFSGAVSFVLSFVFPLVVGEPYYDRLGRSGTGYGYIEKPTAATDMIRRDKMRCARGEGV
jgi:hypothetical protein